MKVYVLIRQDLSPGQRIVQSCHAVASLMSTIGNNVSQNESIRHQALCPSAMPMVVLGVETEESLKSLSGRLGGLASVAAFFEPDLAGQMTAAAFVGNERTREITKKLVLA
jgi:hypothetical protein